MPEKQWYLDGEKVHFKDIIKKGQDCGYESDSGIFQTSIACRYLEKAGYRVEYKEAEETK